MSSEAKLMDMLRRDALERGMWDLAIAYGWAEIRINNETLRKQADRFRDLGQTT